MKVRAYLRVAKKPSSSRGPRAILRASVRATDEPVVDSLGNPLPTVAFAVDLDIPDAMFKRAELVIDPETATIAAEVKK
jgi:hypothetical protein